jgi:creatinine amidohydrolase
MELASLTWPDVDALDRNTPVILPVAALEQHGHHLPVFTDSMLLGEIVRRAHEHLADEVLLAPLTWLGNSHHHMDFPGTLSAEPRVYLDLLCGLVENVLDHGFKRIVMLNGHGGNDVPGKQAMFELRQRHRDRRDLLLLFATYWNLADPASGDDSLWQSEMGHAGEWETSMILRIAPEWVKQHAATEEVPFGNPFLPASRAWVMPDRSVPGHVGIPAEATAEKGERLLTAFSDGVVDMIRRVLRWDGQAWEG